MHFCMLHMGAALLTSPCAVCAAGAQCAANCMGCNKAGAGKCSQCNDGYGLTATRTCARVRPCNVCLRFKIEAQYAFLHVAHGRSAADFTMCCWSAVRCTLRGLPRRGRRQVRLGMVQRGLRADRDWDVRAGTSLQCVLALPIGAQYAFLHVAHGRSAADFTMCCVCCWSAVRCKLHGLRQGRRRQVRSRMVQQGLRADRNWDLRAGASLQRVFAFQN